MQAMPSTPTAPLLSTLLSTLFFASNALLFAPSAHAYPGGGGAFNGKGFDTCAAPSSSQMQAWWTNTPWSWVGVYVGGASRGCSQPNLTAAAPELRRRGR